MNLFFLLVSLFSAAEAKIITKTVEYKDGDTVLEGFLAYDSKSKNAPAVLLVHNWLGVGEGLKKKAEEVAALGYVAFAADIYGKGVRPSAAEAGKISGLYKNDRPLFRRRLRAGLEELRKQKGVDPKRLSSIGYCFGGTGVLELARSGAEVKSVVSFHGGLDSPTPADAKNIKGSVLALHGADDPYVPEAQVKQFEDEMRGAGVDWQLVKYAKAVHAFTEPEAGNDPSKGAAYNELAAKRSWIAMKDFLAETLRK
jgi:dienelactone hydrolase